MKGHGEKLSRKEEQAIIALLTRPTVAEAAQACGTSDVTLWRWMQRPKFADRYRAARRKALEGAIASLQHAAGEAATTLRTLLKAESESVRLGAARAILDQATKGADLLDLEARIAALEAGREAPAAWPA